MWFKIKYNILHGFEILIDSPYTTVDVETAVLNIQIMFNSKS